MLSAYARVYVSVFAIPEIGAVPLKSASVAPTARGLGIGEDDARHRVVVRLAGLAEDVRRDDLALVLARRGSAARCP